MLPTRCYPPGVDVPGGIRFRPVTAADWPGLYRAIYAERPADAMQALARRWLTWQKNDRCQWLLADLINQPRAFIATGQLFLYPHASEVANLNVAPEWRRRQVGTQLVRLLTHLAQAQQYACLEIRVEPDNHAAMLLYQQLGFYESGQVTLPDQRQIIVMSKQLK